MGTLGDAFRAVKKEIAEVKRIRNRIKSKEEADARAIKRRDVTQEHLDAEEYACRKVEPMVRSFLVANFNASGLKSRTGYLLTAISGATVRVTLKGKVTYAFKPGMTGAKSTGKGHALPNSGAIAHAAKIDQTKANKGTVVYKYGNALIEGAVHQPLYLRKVRPTEHGIDTGTYKRAGVLGAKAKRTMKRKLLRLSVSKRALWSMVRLQEKHGRKITGAWTYKKKTITNGKITIVKPRPFFDLSEAQKSAVVEEFLSAVEEYKANRRN